MAKVKNRGVLKTWKDDRGFGFIKPDDGSDDLFIHISALKGMARRPYRGDTIFYQVEHENDGKSKAIDAQIYGVSIHTDKKSKNNNWVWLATIALGLITLVVTIFFGIDREF